MSWQNLVSFLGIFVIIGLGWLCSRHRSRISWRVVAWGVGLQLILAAFIFWVPAGARFFLWVNRAVNAVLDSATAGTSFLFGRLALPPGATDSSGQTSLGFFLAFQALPTIVFFAALMEILYHWRIMPFFIRFFSRLFNRTMRISGAESLSVASNIFVGVESSLVIRPHLKSMTSSELCTILTAGMGTIASSVMALYIMMLQAQFPTIAGHLVSASLIAAPACILMSKLIYPETESPLTLGREAVPVYTRHGSWVEAVIRGAQDGTRLVVGIASLLLAFLGLVALLDAGLGLFAGRMSSWLGLHLAHSLSSLRGLLGYLFYPLVVVCGVPIADAWPVAQLVGERLVATEVASYQHLGQMMAAGQLTDPRSAVIAVYILCGFAHFASMAIFVGGTAALAPERTKELAKLGFRALLAASLACLMTGAVAGAFFSRHSILFGK